MTALEANSEAVPKMENVTERLLHEEQKMKGKGGFKRNCRKLVQLEASKKAGKPKHTANNVAEKEQVPNPTSDDETMVVSHVLSATSKENYH